MAKCELLAPDQGARVTVLTFAQDKNEYEAKVTAALARCGFQVLEVENASSEFLITQKEILTSLKTLREHCDPNEVEIATLKTYPRLM